MLGLILGVMAGVAAGVYWRDDLMRLREKTRGEYAESVRQRAAETLDSLEATVSGGLERTRTAASSTLRSWSRTIRSGEEGGGPTSSTGSRADTM
jgi:hypothetical protein